MTPSSSCQRLPIDRAIAMEGSDATPLRGHVLMLPYPSQGHYNPMLQFGKRLASLGAEVTLAVTRFILRSIPIDPEPGPVALAPISDGFDEAGFAQAGSIPAYLDRFESAGSETLEELIGSCRAQGRPVSVLVYDAFLPWALDAGRRHGLAAAAFFTQSCAVDAVYGHVNRGRLTVPWAGPVSLPGLPRLEPGDLPSFITDPDPGPYPAYLALVLNQFRNLDKADVVLINSFYELEREEADWLKSLWPIKTIGPTIPSSYLDKRLPKDTHYGLHLYAPNTEPCMAWLDSKPPMSVVYISFGSMAALGSEQMEELASGLQNSGRDFMWVVRASELSKLPHGFLQETSERRLVVSWSPQMEVLAHSSVGCFFTHCGWNSTTEALCLGVPMVGMPQWTDQQTNAKYVEDVWGVGVRVKVKVDDKSIVRREEVERCIKEVMEGGRSEEIARNARKWREMAKAAVSDGGSSDKNIAEFIDKYCP